MGKEGKAALLVDTYNPNLVTPEFRQWVEGSLLPQARRTPGLLVVIAGQESPRASAIWEMHCHRLRLQPLDNPDDWLDFAGAIGPQVTRQIIAAFCHSCRGEPYAIAMHLTSLRTWGGAA